jgi:glutamate-5-semialdehyde dehydrogenase
MGRILELQSEGKKRRLLEKPTQKVDLIVPRVGENLITLAKHATCPVIISGRGNNFVYVNKEADLKSMILLLTERPQIYLFYILDKV